MPCDSVVLNRVELPRMNRQLQDRAIAAHGWTVIYPGIFEVEGLGSFQVTGAGLVGRSGQSAQVVGEVADRLKRAYSGEVVKYTAARNGWTVRQVAAYQYEVIK